MSMSHSSCKWCGVSHPVAQLCGAGQRGLTRRSFFFLTGAAVVGMALPSIPLPAKRKLTGEVYITLNVDMRPLIDALTQFDKILTDISLRYALLPKDMTIEMFPIGVVDEVTYSHAEPTEKQEGTLAKYTCDLEWRRRDL